MKKAPSKTVLRNMKIEGFENVDEYLKFLKRKSNKRYQQSIRGKQAQAKTQKKYRQNRKIKTFFLLGYKIEITKLKRK